MRRPHRQSAQPVARARAHALRQQLTFSEQKLWQELRGSKLGVAFRRQVAIGRYIADFAAPSVRLVVEVDGGYHVARKAADKRRDRDLARLGWRVLRLEAGLVVHQRRGAPLQLVSSRRATSPAWTAVELARQLRPPRALATLDAALHSRRCTPAELAAAAEQQKGRRGIVGVRNLLAIADGRAESAMESEARLVMFQHGLPRPELQHLIHGRDGECWRVDFA